jgi:hypothetical protein
MGGCEQAITASMSAASGNAPGTARLRVMIWKSAKRLFTVTVSAAMSLLSQ